jgi:methyltransferase
LPTLLLAAVLALLGAERLAELALNRRNSRWLAARGALWHRPDGFGLLVATQVVLILGLAIEGGFAPWAGTGPWTWPLLGLAILAQGVRYWAIATLGRRWSVRVVTLPGSPRIVGGPYRFFSHPNYVAVLAESIVLPLAFGAWGTALVLVPLTLLALVRRVRREEAALRASAAGA